MISVRASYELGNRIPEEIYRYLPKECKYCKSPVVLNDEFTQMRCSNPKCSGHMAHRASNALEKLGVRGFGPSTCLAFIEENNYDFHLKVLNTELPNYPEMGDTRKERLYHSLNIDRRIDLPVLLELAQVDRIAGKTSERIMGNYNSFEQFFSENDDVNKIINHIKTSLKRKKVTTNTVKMAYNLFKNKEQLLDIEKSFQINKRADLKLSVCMTGDIVTVLHNNSYIKPRSKLVELLNEKYQGVATFINSEKSISGSDVLLTDSSRKTKKYNYANNNNIQISTFGDFVNLLEKTLGPGNEAINITVRRG